MRPQVEQAAPERIASCVHFTQQLLAQVGQSRRAVLVRRAWRIHGLEQRIRGQAAQHDWNRVQAETFVQAETVHVHEQVVAAYETGGSLEPGRVMIGGAKSNSERGAVCAGDGTRYAHLNAGTVLGLRAITLDDVQQRLFSVHRVAGIATPVLVFLCAGLGEGVRRSGQIWELILYRIVLVLEGQAKGGVPAGRDAHVTTVHAPKDGDSTIIAEGRLEPIHYAEIAFTASGAWEW